MHYPNGRLTGMYYIQCRAKFGRFKLQSATPHSVNKTAFSTMHTLEILCIQNIAKYPTKTEEPKSVNDTGARQLTSD